MYEGIPTEKASHEEPQLMDYCSTFSKASRTCKNKHEKHKCLLATATDQTQQ
jgi:hypothetical protein